MPRHAAAGKENGIPGQMPQIALAYVRRDAAADLRYVTAVARAGGVPLPLWRDDPAWEAKMLRAQGLLLTGGGDIDPVLYGAPERGLCCEGVDRARDERELAAYRLARRYGLPILGICRGMQFLNVLYADGERRGSLLVDLPPGGVRHRAFADKTSAFHAVTVTEGTQLAAILGRGGRYTVNSRHHQGMQVEHLAAGLVPSAVADDGIVEALEAPRERFLLGVQCHPERPGEAPEFAAVIRALVVAAGERARR